LESWDKALEEARGAIRLRPNTASNYPNLAIVYMSLNRLDDAEAVFKLAEERKVANEFLLYSPYEVAFLKGDAAQMARDGSGRHGQAGQGRFAAGHASGHRRLGMGG
jgi:tetratricopeptide (TPR) repeat protein